ncbi:hypothetical protein ACIGXI_23315 [Kitasatospora aureofaciens]|uniref:hypothetical protein n=1 Tax=Kitasatospora aureofaciens TaxID=1894 RepID=UPI0037C536F9
MEEEREGTAGDGLGNAGGLGGDHGPTQLTDGDEAGAGGAAVGDATVEDEVEALQVAVGGGVVDGEDMGEAAEERPVWASR